MQIEYNIMDYAPGNKSKENEVREPIPEGKYVAEIIESQEKISGAGNTYLSLKFSICEGPHEGRWIWDNLNVKHPTEKVRSTAMFFLGNICKAVGVLGINDTSELHYKPMEVEVEIEPEQDGYPEKNVIRKYLPQVGHAKERSKAHGLAKEAQTKAQLDQIDSNVRGPSIVGGEIESEPVQDNIPF